MLILIIGLFGAGCQAKSALPVLPTPMPAGLFFTEIIFAEDVTDDGELLGAGETFHAGTPKVWGFFRYSGMTDGSKWGRLWKQNGEVFIDSTDEIWDDGDSGWLAYSVKGAPALSGDFSLTLYIDGKAVQEAHFYVPPLPTPTPDLNPPEFGPIQFASAVTEDYRPVKPLVDFNPGVTTMYAVFPFDHVKDGTPWRCEWLYAGLESASADLIWDLGNHGYSYCTYFNDDGTAIEAGEYTFNLIVDGKLEQTAVTHVLETAQGAGSGVAQKSRVDADLLPVWDILRTSENADIQTLVAWAEQNQIELVLGDAGSELALYECPVGGKSGDIIVSVARFRRLSWEETAAAIAREIVRAKTFSTQSTCTCRTQTEADAVSAQILVFKDTNRINQIPPELSALLDGAGNIDPMKLETFIEKKYPKCQ